MQETAGFIICLLGSAAALWAVITWQRAQSLGRGTTKLQSWVAPIGTGGIVALPVGLSLAFMTDGSATFELVRWVIIGFLVVSISAFLVFWHFLIAGERV